MWNPSYHAAVHAARPLFYDVFSIYLQLRNFELLEMPTWTHVHDVYMAYGILSGLCAAMATSFKKKGSSRPSHPRGTRPSLHNAQLLVSTGVPSLDALLGIYNTCSCLIIYRVQLPQYRVQLPHRVVVYRLAACRLCLMWKSCCTSHSPRLPD